MSKATVELDFFAMAAEKLNHTNNFTRNSTFRGISRINPALLRRVIATGGVAAGPPAIPIFNPNLRVVPENSSRMAPITIFYNGTVNVFDVNQDTAEYIIKMAGEESGSDRMTILGDLPQARKKSLQRFLEKRKERLTALGPYTKEREVGSAKEKGEDTGFIAARNF